MAFFCVVHLNYATRACAAYSVHKTRSLRFRSCKRTDVFILYWFSLSLLFCTQLERLVKLFFFLSFFIRFCLTVCCDIRIRNKKKIKVQFTVIHRSFCILVILVLILIFSFEIRSLEHNSLNEPNTEAFF